MISYIALLQLQYITIQEADIIKHHKRIFKGIIYANRRVRRWFDQLLKQNDSCIVCGSKINLEPHHIIPTHSYDKMFYDVGNGAVMCSACHAHYHQTCHPINHETLMEFCTKNSSKKPKEKRKSKKRFARKKYEHSPLYSKIKIRDFNAKGQRKVKYKSKYRYPKKEKRSVHLNPIYLSENIGCDDWGYYDRISIEKEVLGDY